MKKLLCREHRTLKYRQNNAVSGTESAEPGTECVSLLLLLSLLVLCVNLFVTRSNMLPGTRTLPKALRWVIFGRDLPAVDVWIMSVVDSWWRGIYYIPWWCPGYWVFFCRWTWRYPTSRISRSSILKVRRTQRWRSRSDTNPKWCNRDRVLCLSDCSLSHFALTACRQQHLVVNLCDPHFLPHGQTDGESAW